MPLEDTLSTAWYCGGATAGGDGGLAEMTLVMANDAPEGATAEVTFLTAKSGNETEPQVVEVPANGSAVLSASDVLTADWVGAIVEVRGGRVAVERQVRGPLGYDASPCSTAAANNWFVPSGTTVRGSELYLSFFNPFPDTASIDVSFSTESGPRSPRALRGLSIPGRTIRVVAVGKLVTDRQTVAARVQSRVGRIVVDRVQTYDGTGPQITTSNGAGEVVTPAPKGLVSAPASPVRAQRWVLTGSRISEGVRSQIAVYNPGSKVAEVDVVLGYQDPQRFSDIAPLELSIRPRQHVMVDLNTVEDLEPDSDVWIDVRSLDSQPVVVERVSVYGTPSEQVGVATQLASPVGARNWLVVQGGATQSSGGSVQVANPGPSDAQIKVFVLEKNNRRELTGAATKLNANDRRVLDLEGAGEGATVIVEASHPVVVSSSQVQRSGLGISLSPAFAFPETIAAFGPVS